MAPPQVHRSGSKALRLTMCRDAAGHWSHRCFRWQRRRQGPEANSDRPHPAGGLYLQLAVFGQYPKCRYCNCSGCFTGLFGCHCYCYCCGNSICSGTYLHIRHAAMARLATVKAELALTCLHCTTEALTMFAHTKGALLYSTASPRMAYE